MERLLLRRSLLEWASSALRFFGTTNHLIFCGWLVIVDHCWRVLIKMQSVLNYTIQYFQCQKICRYIWYPWRHFIKSNLWILFRFSSWIWTKKYQEKRYSENKVVKTPERNPETATFHRMICQVYKNHGIILLYHWVLFIMKRLDVEKTRVEFAIKSANMVTSFIKHIIL